MDYEQYHHIPNNLRKYRESKDLTQLQVAQTLGLKDKTLISRWEKGRALPNIVSIIRLSKLYCVSIEQLFSQLIDAVEF